MARAWEAATAELAPGWAIYYLHGESTDGFQPPFWIACAAGPKLHFDYAEGYGPTPDAALIALARNLRARESAS